MGGRAGGSPWCHRPDRGPGARARGSGRAPVGRTHIDRRKERRRSGRTGAPQLPARPVLLAGDSLGFIDFDGFCQAEPALDVALFRTSVRQLGSGPAHDEILDQLAAEFLDEYSKQVPVSRVRVALWEALDLLTRVLHCWTKVKPERASEAMSALERHLASEPLGLSV
jgi:hypothetical protein